MTAALEAVGTYAMLMSGVRAWVAASPVSAARLVIESQERNHSRPSDASGLPLVASVSCCVEATLNDETVAVRPSR